MWALLVLVALTAATWWGTGCLLQADDAEPTRRRSQPRSHVRLLEDEAA